MTVAVIFMIMMLFCIIAVSGCLTPGQALDKGINETVNITGNVVDNTMAWFV